MKRYILVMWDCGHGWEIVENTEDENFIFPWFRTYEEAENIAKEIIAENERDYICRPDFAGDSDNFFIFGVETALEWDITYTDRGAVDCFRKALQEVN